METYKLGKSRHLCWDDFLIDKCETIELVMHKPIKKELALVADKQWEGVCNGYASVKKIGDTYRLYYRACSSRYDIDGNSVRNLPPAYCLALSSDGKSFKHPKLGVYDVVGRDNNIIYFENKYVDNFAVIYDENPACPPEEKYKALKMGNEPGSKKPSLYLHTSPDGVHFDTGRLLDLDGEFDSYNVYFWDKETEQYFIYYRGCHWPRYSEYEETEGNTHELRLLPNGDTNEVRDISVATTKDFISFENFGEIRFIDDDVKEDIQYYTNNILKYPRADDMFIGIPARYINRKDDSKNFESMPVWEKRNKLINVFGRGGTALTDAIIITSRDGFNFRRTDEAFFTPSVECDANWWYGDCFFAYGMEETESDVEGAPNELSIYVGEGYRVKNVHFRRYTLRLDGFFSWYAKYRGGLVLTKPFTFEGSELEINFATSALGHVVIALCDEEGNEIEGFKTGKLFGDSIDRKVEFQNSLSALNGKPVRLKFEIKDAHLYSFKFN